MRRPVLHPISTSAKQPRDQRESVVAKMVVGTDCTYKVQERQANIRSELLPNSDDEEMQALPHTDDAEAHADEEDTEEEPETVTE